ncbi:hypothetical protein Y032_0035g3040 [Ancylostoma ceylanicum]|uniref:Uncharacterized protein n=1 Tax=Ancylostoma ceylanicum TaxID=53326 RepID=A0A016ULX6_9BILA|nr:hypothetical protein Y032_0035g3040 [Ancylostoma ceylanicum]
MPLNHQISRAFGQVKVQESKAPPGAIDGIRPEVHVAHIRARADPFQPCQQPLALSLSTKDLNGWNGSARERICDATSTPGRMPCTIRHSLAHC